MQLLATKFNQIASAIEFTNAQILALQTKLSELQEHQQQLLSVEQACQSALAQVGTALSMLNHVDPAEIGTFKAAVEAQFGTDAIAFLESATPTPAEPVEPEPTAPTALELATSETETDSTIDVEVTPETVAPIEPATPTTDIEGRLNKLSIQSIRKLGAAKGVGGFGSRSEIAARLKALVTESDLLAAG